MKRYCVRHAPQARAELFLASCEPNTLAKRACSILASTKRGSYAHIGQHSGCDYGWYLTTRPTKPAEYTDLKTELESAPYGYRLKVYQRMNRTLRNRFMTEVHRLNQPVPVTA
jgi:hypothetical protein